MSKLDVEAGDQPLGEVTVELLVIALEGEKLRAVGADAKVVDAQARYGRVERQVGIDQQREGDLLEGR